MIAEVLFIELVLACHNVSYGNAITIFIIIISLAIFSRSKSTFFVLQQILLTNLLWFVNNSFRWWFISIYSIRLRVRCTLIYEIKIWRRLLGERTSLFITEIVLLKLIILLVIELSIFIWNGHMALVLDLIVTTARKVCIHRWRWCGKVLTTLVILIVLDRLSVFTLELKLFLCIILRVVDRLFYCGKCDVMSTLHNLLVAL